jgi:hypothetical protein
MEQWKIYIESTRLFYFCFDGVALIYLYWWSLHVVFYTSENWTNRDLMGNVFIN